MSDLWTEASRDIEQDATDRLLVNAQLQAAPILPFLTAAVSQADFDQRVALAEDRIVAAAGGDMHLAAQVVAKVRNEMTYPEPAPVKKRSFRIEADTAGGGYYVVDEDTGQDVGSSYPDQAAAEQAAQGNPELQVEHTPTGNPSAPGLTQGGPDASGGAEGEGTPDAAPDSDASDPAATAPPSADGVTPADAPSGAGDAGEDATSDSDDPQFPPSKTSVKVGSFHVALQEGEDPLLPVLELLDQGEGQAEQPSYHTDSQQQLGAPTGHANGEIGTSDPEGDFMSAPDTKSPYKASKGGGNPFVRSASLTKEAWTATHEDGHDSPADAPSGTFYEGKVTVPKGLRPHIKEGENIPRFVADTMPHMNTRSGHVAGPFKVGETHTAETDVWAGRHHPSADSAGMTRVQMPGTVLGIHTEDDGRSARHTALIRQADGNLAHRYHHESKAPAWDDFKNTITNPRANPGASVGLR